MNHLLRSSSTLVQRLLGTGGASSIKLQMGAATPLLDQAVAGMPLSNHWQRMSLSTESGGGDTESGEAPPPPKKRRGRPPKAAKADDVDSRTTAESTHFPSSAVAAELAAPAPSATMPPILTQKEIKKTFHFQNLPPLTQGLATVTTLLAPRDPATWHSHASITTLFPTTTTTTTADEVLPPVGFYMEVPSDSLPEAQAAFFYDPLLVEERVKQTHYGCKGATAEFESSGRRALLHRPVIADLVEAVTSGQHTRILVDGWTGSGKSIALYTLAASARAAGKVVMYVPSATLFIQGGRFYRSGDDDDDGDEADGMWDTPEAARHVLNAVMNAHGDALANIPVTNGGSDDKSLADVAREGLASTTTGGVVEAAIDVKDGMLAHENCMVIVDDYNALYSHTAYHEPMHEFYRRPIAADELRLASSFRVLESADSNPGTGKCGIAVVAPTFSAGISPTLRMKNVRGTHKVRVPRFNLNEVSAVAAMSVATEALPTMPDEDILRRALALTNGNAKELRELQSTLFLAEGPIGPSLGYKAFAVARKQYSLALDV